MSTTVFTWEDVVAAEVGKVFHDSFENGVRFIVLRGPFHLCAYLGIPLSHPLAGFSEDDIPVDCHGGLTWSRAGSGGYLPEGFWWYGWDYGHCDDYMISESISAAYAEHNDKLQKWDVDGVLKDAWEAKYSFSKLVRLAERITAKGATQ